jgi:hypothetical protein
MNRTAVLVAVLLASPAAAFAGHVESDVLRTGNARDWWKNNKTRVIDGLARSTSTVTLDDLVTPGNSRTMYMYYAYLALTNPPGDSKKDVWTSDAAWKTDIIPLAKRYQKLAQDLQERQKHFANLGGAEFRAEVTAAYSDSKSLDRLTKFMKHKDVEEYLFSGLRKMGGMGTPEAAVVDLSMLLMLLDQKNKAFFMNGYSNDAITPTSAYAGLYANFSWKEADIQAMRADIERILVEIGKPALPIMREVWGDFERAAKNGSSVTLNDKTQARKYNWSTKDTRFHTPVAPRFKEDFQEVAKAISHGTTSLNISTWEPIEAPVVIREKDPGKPRETE